MGMCARCNVMQLDAWPACKGNTYSSAVWREFLWPVQDEDTTLSLAELVREPHGIATVVFEIISTAAMLPFIYIEVCTIHEYGFMGWLDFWCALAPSRP